MDHVIMDGVAPRMSQVSPEIIGRAIDFAIRKGLRLIWIDQECINQDDAQDKALHIQAMHLIFRRAQYAPAILNNALNEQWHVDLLTHEEPAMLLDLTPLARIAKVSQWLASDIWYTRAWTYQEALLATRGIYLRIPFHPNLCTGVSHSSSQLLIPDFDLVTIFEVIQSSWRQRDKNDDTTRDTDADQLSSALDVLGSAVPA